MPNSWAADVGDGDNDEDDVVEEEERREERSETQPGQEDKPVNQTDTFLVVDFEKGKPLTLTVAPGQVINLTVEIIDQNGDLYSDENDASALIDFKTQNEQKPGKAANQSSTWDGKVASKDGRFVFSNLIFKMWPDSSAVAVMTVRGLKSYGNIVGETFPEVNVEFIVKARPCLEGERFATDLSCVPCNPGYYSLLK